MTPATTPADGELLPCPFCYGTNIEFGGYSPRVYARCKSCKAEGPYAYKQDSAIAAWNRRPTPSPTQAGPEDVDDVWPIVNVTVNEDGQIESAKLYAPGLPPGNHDVYPVRVPYMDEHTEAWLAVAKARMYF